MDTGPHISDGNENKKIRDNNPIHTTVCRCRVTRSVIDTLGQKGTEMRPDMRNTIAAVGIGLAFFLQSTQGATFYVSPSGSNIQPYVDWTTAATNIQDAVNEAGAGDTVLVTNGTYILSSQITIDEGVAVRSATGPDSTTIDGNGEVRCVRLSHVDAILDGFTITNGYLLSPPEDRYAGGSGVFVWHGGTVTNCTIVGNLTEGSKSTGGGVCLWENALLTHCRIISNEAFNGGGVGCHPSTRVEFCTVTDNLAGQDGGGIYFYSGSTTVRHCEIMRNHQTGESWGGGGGVFARGDGGLVEDCLIALNRSADSGGGVLVKYGATIRSCVVRDNIRSPDTGNAGGVYIQGGTVENCLITGNNDAKWAGGVTIYNGGVLRNCTIAQNNRQGLRVSSLLSSLNFQVINCIIYGNELSDVIASSGESASFTNCCIGTCSAEFYGSGSMLGIDPAFADIQITNLHLSSGSPCIDAGYSVPGIANDLDGTPRALDGDALNGPAYDIGCYEYVHAHADSDGDSFLDASELLAGTDPVDAKSLFQILDLASTNGCPVITWQTVYGKSYRILRSRSLISNVWTNVCTSPIAETDATPEGRESFTDTEVQQGSQVYYRVVLD
jgi:hypothetical protein